MLVARDSLSSTTASQVIAKPITTTIYTVRGTIANGCFAEQSVTVTTYESPVADFDLSSDKICTGQPLSVTNKSLNATGYIGIGAMDQRPILKVVTSLCCSW
jgi:hypothetical protein